MCKPICVWQRADTLILVFAEQTCRTVHTFYIAVYIMNMCEYVYTAVSWLYLSLWKLVIVLHAK